MKPTLTTRTAVIAVGLLAALTVAGATGLACSGDAPSTTAPSATAAPSTSDTQPATYVTVDVQQAFDALSTNTDAQIVDVREPSEWATTGVPVGAVLIPLGQLEQRASAELAKDRPVYVLCNSGNRSRTGSEILLKLGFTEVYNVAGGIQAWLRAGLAVEAYQP